MNNEKQSSAGVGENGKRETKKYKRFGTRQEIRVFKNGAIAEVDEKGVWSLPEHPRRREFLTLRNCDYCGNEYPARYYKGIVALFCSGRCRNLARAKPFTDEERFFRMVNKSDGCWIYTGTPALIYGRFRISSNKVVAAHRFSYELVNGPIPEGLYACHKCDTPKCVNPDHIFLGTLKDNTQDCIQKGRFHFHKGEEVGTAVLTEEQVLRIRNGPYSTVRFKRIANELGVGSKHIQAVYAGRRWGHLTT